MARTNTTNRYAKFVFCRKCQVWIEKIFLKPDQTRCSHCGTILHTKPRNSKMKAKYIENAHYYDTDEGESDSGRIVSSE